MWRVGWERVLSLGNFVVIYINHLHKSIDPCTITRHCRFCILTRMEAVYCVVISIDSTTISSFQYLRERRACLCGLSDRAEVSVSSTNLGLCFARLSCVLRLKYLVIHTSAVVQIRGLMFWTVEVDTVSWLPGQQRDRTFSICEHLAPKPCLHNIGMGNKLPCYRLTHELPLKITTAILEHAWIDRWRLAVICHNVTSTQCGRFYFRFLTLIKFNERSNFGQRWVAYFGVALVDLKH